jgi:hypothetical protein
MCQWLGSKFVMWRTEEVPIGKLHGGRGGLGRHTGARCGGP